MPSPFPVMDPYLENPDLFPDVHHALISECQNLLNKVIRPHYVARVDLRVYADAEEDSRHVIPDTSIEKTNGKSGRASSEMAALAIAEPMVVPIVFDEEIEEAYLEFKNVKTGALVTVIEVLSPSNKVPGSDGRVSFMKKRRETLVSEVNWVEIDLLRTGLPSQKPPVECDYRVYVSKDSEYCRARFWPVSVRQALPVIGIPLRKPDADVPLELGAVLSAAYERAAYDLSVDYTKPPAPPLSKTDAKWADKLLRSAKVR